MCYQADPYADTQLMLHLIKFNCYPTFDPHCSLVSLCYCDGFGNKLLLTLRQNSESFGMSTHLMRKESYILFKAQTTQDLDYSSIVCR